MDVVAIINCADLIERKFLHGSSLGGTSIKPVCPNIRRIR